MDINLYENALFTDITGPAIRPGGLSITKAGVEACGFGRSARILDIGCGLGASVEFINKEYGFDCAGIDISQAQIDEGLKRNRDLDIFQGDAHTLGFPDCSMDGVLAECSFSLMEDRKRVLDEIKRVLKDGGYLVISDIYIREGAATPPAGAPGRACFLNALELGALYALLGSCGFSVVLFEDHTRELKELMADIIFKHGSMRSFRELIWGRAEACDTMCREGRNVKFGYFLMVSRLKKREQGEGGELYE